MVRQAVTGAFGFSGRHIAARLLDRGDEVVTLTNHPNRPDPFGGRIAVAPLAFNDRAALTASLRGVDVLFNTYWVRFEHDGRTHDDAVSKSAALFAAARDAGVRRIVHVSVANPDPRSDLPYYSGKARVEDELAASGVGHAVLRPAVLFGDEPMLINTLAWLLRHVPVFAIPGDGRAPVQPVSVGDLADLALEAATVDDDVTWDAAGPETLTFKEMVRAVRRAVSSHALLVHVPGPVALLGARALSLVLRDTLLTADELKGLTDGLLVSHEPPRGTTRFSTWLAESGAWLGRRHLSELARHWT